MSEQTPAHKAQPVREPERPTQAHSREGDGATQAFNQEQDAVAQMGTDATTSINEGGRTNDSHAQTNPKGAVHGLPQPALKGTWR